VEGLYRARGKFASRIPHGAKSLTDHAFDRFCFINVVSGGVIETRDRFPLNCIAGRVGGSKPARPDNSPNHQTIPEGESLSMEEREDNTIYKVVVNHEEQYSIWPADRENALGWSDAGKSGTKAECLAYIEEVWTDMRPLSLRKKMEEA
jgi:MbtH protein